MLVHAVIIFTLLSGQVVSQQHVDIEKRLCGLKSRGAVLPPLVPSKVLGRFSISCG